MYAHNQKNLVRRGQRVAAGQIIGRIGKGDPSPKAPNGRFLAHLHFEIRLRGTRDIVPQFWASAAMSRAEAFEFIQSNYDDPLKFLAKVKAIKTLPDD